MLLAAVGAFFSLGVASAVPSSAASAESDSAIARSFVLVDSTPSGFSEIEMSLTQQLVQVTDDYTGRTVDKLQWEACVTGWTDDSLFSTCGAPLNMQASMPNGVKAGKVWFDLRDPIWGDTATVRVDLPKAKLVPVPSYSVGRGSYGGSTSVVGTAALTQEARATGQIRIVTHRGDELSQSTFTFSGPDVVDLSENADVLGTVALP